MPIIIVAALIASLLAGAELAPRQTASAQQAQAAARADRAATLYLCRGDAFYWAAGRQNPPPAPVCTAGPFNAGLLVPKCQDGTTATTRAGGGFCCPAPGFAS